LSQSPAITF